jgi:hypothetical protein
MDAGAATASFWGSACEGSAERGSVNRTIRVLRYQTQPCCPGQHQAAAYKNGGARRPPSKQISGTLCLPSVSSRQSVCLFHLRPPVPSLRCTPHPASKHGPRRPYRWRKHCLPPPADKHRAVKPDSPIGTHSLIQTTNRAASQCCCALLPCILTQVSLAAS